MTDGLPPVDAAALRELERTRDLLRTVFHAPRFEDTDFLEWVYLRNPIGGVVAQNSDTEDGRRAGHIGGVPVRLRRGQPGPTLETVTALMLLNSSVATWAQQRGLYVSLLKAIGEQAASLDHSAVMGVANARSTGPCIKGYGMTHLAKLPARFCPPVARPTGVQSFTADPAFCASALLDEVTEGLDTIASGGWVLDWTSELLRWRLRTPGAVYSVHLSDAVFAVSTTTKVRGMNVAVLLKLLPRSLAEPHPVDAAPIIGALARHHRTPLVLYAGFNEFVRARGVRVRQDWLPAPLNLLYRATPLHQRPPGTADHEFRMSIFEFFDFDAY